VSVELRPTSDVRVLGILNDYPQTPVAGGVQIAMGDAYGQERRRLVFELSVPSLATLGVANVAEVVVRYVSVGQQVAAHELTLPVTVNLVSADEAAAAQVDTEVSEEVVILAAARAPEQARVRAERGEFEEAKRLLERAARDLRVIAPTSERAEELLTQARQTEEHAAMMDVGHADRFLLKRMKFESYQRQRGRPRREA
jgi:Ca-activated chloride channel family protein